MSCIILNLEVYFYMKINVGSISKNAMSEDNGNLSSMRILILIIIITVLFNWTYYNITSGTLASFSWQDIGVIIGPLLAKAYQKGKENGENVIKEGEVK